MDAECKLKRFAPIISKFEALRMLGSRFQQTAIDVGRVCYRDRTWSFCKLFLKQVALIELRDLRVILFAS